MMRRGKRHTMKQVIELYKDETGATDIDMHKLADFAMDKLGWRPPSQLSPRDLLAREFSRAAREETRHDKSTKRSYRAYHAYPSVRDGEPLTLWVDIDEAPRGPMDISLKLRRQQMVDDGYHLALDADHWNAIHPEEPSIELVFDFTDDINERKNAPFGEEDAG